MLHLRSAFRSSMLNRREVQYLVARQALSRIRGPCQITTHERSGLGPSALTSSGRIRLANGGEIDADVLAQPVLWKESHPPTYTAVAHAVFARVGGYDFQWKGASHAGGGVDSDF